MAPIEAEAAARNNLFAYAPLGGHVALVVGLTAHVLVVARRAAKSLPPTTSTRSQPPLRRRHAMLFSALAALSLASVTVFAVLWRAISYATWAGSPGTGVDGRWYLGDWVQDIDLQSESDRVALFTPEGFLYTTQHFLALMVSSIFFGIQGTTISLFTNCVSMRGLSLPPADNNTIRPPAQLFCLDYSLICSTRCLGESRLCFELVLRHNSLHTPDRSQGRLPSPPCLVHAFASDLLHTHQPFSVVSPLSPNRLSSP
jgi:hypothetical protein